MRHPPPDPCKVKVVRKMTMFHLQAGKHMKKMGEHVMQCSEGSIPAVTAGAAIPDHPKQL